MHLDSRIGQLGNGHYYCFHNGYDKPEFVGTLEQVEIALGLRQPPKKQVSPQPRASQRLRTYVVTITPRFVMYADSATFGEYTVEVDAKSNAEAISVARKERTENEGRFAVPATYRARLARELDLSGCDWSDDSW